MATELKAGVLGLDERQVDALRRAGVDTAQKLAQADAEALARRTGLAADDVRAWKSPAAQMAGESQSAPVRRRSLAVVYVILALIVITAVAVLYAVYAPAGLRTRVAQQEQKLAMAAQNSASVAAGYVDAAARDVGSANWGTAQNDLNQAGEQITFMEQIAPERMASAVEQARSRLGQAQEAVGRRDDSAARRITDLRDTLAPLSGSKSE